MTAASGAQAIANADRYDTYAVGMCLQFVRDKAWQVGSFYGSAIDAWNGAKWKHPGDRNPPDGAPCFYAGGSYGHIVVHRKHGSGRMRSTDCPSSGRVTDADLSWPEQAWGDDYLGWTEDLNGVRLPLGKDDDMPLTEDDLEKIAGRVNRVLGDYTSDGEPRDTKDAEGNTERADERLRQIENVVRRLETKVDKLAKG